ncbi:hypothetical protein AB6A40_001727 [Gnathostoma spinigerum]|uniref:BHLH domain-containing protein n=1 Tax=Gnathostoma spinigerum TaxID=75299 RepID=A0ABD6E4Z7_9BILA
MERAGLGGRGSKDLKKSPDTTDKKKATHLRCERQRREAINNGYHELRSLLPSSLSSLGCKTTNAAILFRASDYLTQLKNDYNASDESITQLLAQVSALELIAQQYESMSAENPTPDKASIQCEMIQAFLDSCFASFCAQVDVTGVPNITRTLLPWIENLDYEKVSRDVLAAAYKRPRYTSVEDPCE